MNYVYSITNTITDKLGDATIYVLDELKFWGEVAIDFMELDKNSSDQILDDFRKDLREQVKEHKEYDEEIELLRNENKEPEEEVELDIEV